MSEELIKKRRNIVHDYRCAVLASIILKHHITKEWNTSYEFYFGAYLENENYEATPDFFLEGESIDLIGDLKRSLPNPPKKEDIDDIDSLEEYLESDKVREFIENKLEKITEQLRKYDKEYPDCKTPHDLFFLYNNRYKKSINIWKDKMQADLSNNFVGLKYHVENRAGNREKTMSVEQHIGEFSDQRLNRSFDVIGCDWHYSESPELIDEHKIATIDENHQSPIEYVMLVLWQNIFDEINQSSDTEKILQRMRTFDEGDSPEFEIDLDSIIKYLNKYYTLDFYDKRRHSQNERTQFARKLVEQAMNRFEKIELTDVERIESGKNPRYKIKYKPLAKSGDALESLIDSLAEKDLLGGEEVSAPPKQEKLTDFS